MDNVHWRHRPDGPSLQYAAWGPADGTPVVMLHGITDSWRSFEPLVPHLPPWWRVVAPSQRGHGDSERPRDGDDTRTLAADAAALIDALALAPAVVVGHSMGAAVALQPAIDRRDAVLALAGLGTLAGLADHAALREFVLRDVAALADPIPPASVRAFVADTVERELPPHRHDTIGAESLKLPACVWRSAFDALLDDSDWRDALHRVHAPALRVWGDADALVGAAHTEALLRRLPRARLRVHHGVGHSPHREAPARVGADLHGFVATL